jgi:hypothetical protein
MTEWIDWSGYAAGREGDPDYQQGYEDGYRTAQRHQADLPAAPRPPRHALERLAAGEEG